VTTNYDKTQQGRSYSSLYVPRIATLTLLLILPVPVLAKSSCPLTEEQSQKAVAAWTKVSNFLTSEPRCVNCHGGVNPYMDGIGLDPNDPNAPFSLVEHGGGKQEHENTGLMDQKCKKCHNDMARKGQWVEVGDKAPPPAPAGAPSDNWTTAPSFLSFVDKDTTAICRQVKRSTGSAEEFIGHLKNDNGKTNFAGTAFLGNRGLSEEDLEGFSVKIEPPSVSHAAVVKLGEDWVNAMGGKFQGDENCGCELTHDNWSGRVTYVIDSKGDEGHEQWSDWSNRSMTMITLSVKDGVGTVRYTVQGKDVVHNRSVYGYGTAKKENHSSSTSTTSIDQTYPARAEVLIYQGTYMVSLGQAWHSTIGKRHVENCDDAHGCQSADLDVYQPTLPPPRGKAPDPNRIQDSATQVKQGQGRSHKGVSIERMTVDLWRSSSN